MRVTGRGEAAALIRSVIEKIVLTPDESRRELVIDLYGDLAGILRIASGQSVEQPMRLSDQAETEIQQLRLLTTEACESLGSAATMVPQLPRADWLGRPESDQPCDNSNTVGLIGWGGRSRSRIFGVLSC